MSEQISVERKAYICKGCAGVYADEPVTKCDCMPDKQEWIEAAIVYRSTIATPAQEPVASVTDDDLLEAIEQEVGMSHDGWDMVDTSDLFAAFRKHLGATPAPTTPVLCSHRLADARNPAITSGYVCIDCGAVFAATPSASAQKGFVSVPVDAYLWLMGMGNDGFSEDRRGAFWWRSAFNERAGLDMMAIYEASRAPKPDA